MICLSKTSILNVGEGKLLIFQQYQTKCLVMLLTVIIHNHIIYEYSHYLYVFMSIYTTYEFSLNSIKPFSKGTLFDREIKKKL